MYLTFHDLSLKNDCSNPPGESILLKFSEFVTEGLKQKSQKLGAIA